MANSNLDSIKRYYDSIGKGDRAWIIKPDVKLYAMKAGDCILRIMPPIDPEDFSEWKYMYIRMWELIMIPFYVWQKVRKYLKRIQI